MQGCILKTPESSQCAIVNEIDMHDDEIADANIHFCKHS